MKNFLFLGCMFLLSLFPKLTWAQEKMNPVEYKGEDSNKMFVVFLVISVIFLGIIIFLFSLERKIKKLEKINQTINSNQ